MDRSWRWISLLILGIGSLFIAGGALLGYGSLKLVMHGERVQGEVTEIRREGNMYAPVLRFRLPSGEWREVKDLGSGAPDFSVGDQVTILYAPDDPDDLGIATFDRLWFSALFVTVFGCFWLLFGFVAWGLLRGVDLFILGERMFATISIAAAIIGSFASWSTWSLYRSGTHAEGIVSEVRASRHSDREDVTLRSGRELSRDVERTSLAPVVHFKTREGREIEFFGRGGSGTSYAQGDVVTVVYDPAQPSDARILSFMDLWMPAAVAWTVAVIFGGVVMLSRWVRRKAA